MSTDRKPWTYSLVELRAAAEKACEKAIAKKSEFKNCGANWADFGVREVAETRNDAGEVGHYVLIEETAYDASLYGFIYAELAASGFPDVEIRLEW